MTDLFLACALALQPVAFNGEAKIHDIRNIQDFVKSHVPGAEITITPAEQGPPSPFWERFPLDWGGMQVWIKRPVVYDTPPINRRPLTSA